MASHKAAISITSAVLALAVTTSACSSSGNSSTSSSSPAASTSMSSPANPGSMPSSMSPSSSMPMSPSSSMPMSAAPASATDATTTAAAELRAGLTQLLRQHVNLTLFAVQTAVTDGLTAKSTANALKALDDNTVALGKAVGSVYGKSAETQFDKLWRAHIGFFVNYTKGLATKDGALVAKAQKQLAGYRADFAKFFGGATGLPAAAISADLQGHVQTLEAAIRAVVTEDPTVGSKQTMAAMHMDGTAQVLAGAIAKQKKLAGNADGQASSLRAGLTGLLIQHVAQTVTVVQSAKNNGLAAAQTTDAVKALDGNTVDLGKAIGSVYGKSAQTAFLKMWRAHIGFFVDYTKGLASKDNAAVAKAQKQLAGYRADFSKFLGSATGLPAAAVSGDLQGHVQTLEAAIKAILTDSPTAAQTVSMAEDHMAGTGAVLAKAIAAQKKLS